MLGIVFEGLGRSRTRGAAAALAMGLVLAGCTAAAPTGSAPATGSASAGPSASAATSPIDVPSATPAVTPTDTPLPTDFVDSSPTPTPPLPTGPLPSVAPAPAGQWTAINWLAVPGGHAPTVEPDAFGAQWINVFGWSGGYVDFVWNDVSRTIVPWHSSDGLAWQAGPKMNLGKLLSGIQAADKFVGGHSSCSLDMDGFAAASGSMLVKGYLTCEEGCGSWISGELMWRSTDGAGWALDARTFSGPAVGDISGGSIGYIATDSYGTTETVWTSADGLSWRQGKLPTAALGGSKAQVAGQLSLGSPVAFGDGYVIPGALRGPLINGCALPGPGPLETPALWWSADGSNWTKDALSGTTPAYHVDMTVDRITDGALLARQDSYDDQGNVTATAAWTSTDGKTWRKLAGPSLSGLSAVSDGNHGLLIDDGLFDQATHQPAALAIYGFDASLNPVLLRETGSLPWAQGKAVLGPTGLLWTGDGTRFWLGVPTAG
jgi:hypothetical protein